VHLTIELTGLLLNQILAKGAVHDIIDAFAGSRDRSEIVTAASVVPDRSPK